MKTAEELISHIGKLIEEKYGPRSIDRVLRASGAGKNLLQNMGQNKKPAMDSFVKLAVYMEISLDYLLGLVDNPIRIETSVIESEPPSQPANNDLIITDTYEKELIKSYRALEPRTQHRVLTFVYDEIDNAEKERMGKKATGIA